MTKSLLIATAASIMSFPALADTGSAAVSEEALLDRYLSASQAQQDKLRGASMEVDIDASVPKLNKTGKLHALRNISKLGKITYHMLGFNGDNAVKKEVIARYLTADVQAQEGESLSITPDNYKFKYKGAQELNGRQVQVYQLSPKKKRVGLFKGELWLDQETAMPVRESGRFVKSPSIFLKKMDFVRVYELENGVSIPQSVQSTIETRLFGPVELSINFTHFCKVAETDEVASAATLETR
jgi:hypothetical protein